MNQLVRESVCHARTIVIAMAVERLDRLKCWLLYCLQMMRLYQYNVGVAKDLRLYQYNAGVAEDLSLDVEREPNLYSCRERD
jgi:hypothetical protein